MTEKRTEAEETRTKRKEREAGETRKESETEAKTRTLAPRKGEDLVRTVKTRTNINEKRRIKNQGGGRR